MPTKRLGIIALFTFLVVILNGNLGLTTNSHSSQVSEAALNWQFISNNRVLAQSPDERKVKVEEIDTGLTLIEFQINRLYRTQVSQKRYHTSSISNGINCRTSSNNPEFNSGGY